MSGIMPASSDASSELSTASLTAIKSDFVGLSKPRRCLFFSKNSLTEISFCSFAKSSAFLTFMLTFLQKFVYKSVRDTFYNLLYRLLGQSDVLIFADQRNGLAI